MHCLHLIHLDESISGASDHHVLVQSQGTDCTIVTHQTSTIDKPRGGKGEERGRRGEERERGRRGGGEGNL